MRPGDTPGWLATPDDSRGMRRLLTMVGGDPAREAASALLGLPPSARIVVCTGFPVAGRPETDGPPGALALASALRSLRRRVALVSWREVLNALSAHAMSMELIDVSRTAPLSDPAVAIEACGRSDDGIYRNMRGEDISAVAPRFEDVLRGPLVVGVGDGGNELGMGAAPLEFYEGLPFPRPSLSAQVLVPASVSNWGALAIVAEISRATERDLLPSRAVHRAILDDLLARDFVDGPSGTAIPCVDGHPFSEELDLLDSLRVSR